MLERANLFIIPLDNERDWYRYHHLFTDLLRQRLEQGNSEQIPENTSYRSVTWLGWAKALPDKLVSSRPVLSSSCGWASLDTGDLGAAEHYFQDAEQWLNTALNGVELYKAASVKTAALDDEEFRSLSISIANGRAYLAQALGDIPVTIKYAQWASVLLREDEYFERSLTDILLGFAYWSSGDLTAAYQAVSNAVTKMQKTGKTPFIFSFTSYLTDIMTAQGRLREVEKTYIKLLEPEMRIRAGS